MTKIAIWGVYRSGTTFLYDIVFNHIHGIENNTAEVPYGQQWNLYELLAEPYHPAAQFHSKQQLAQQHILNSACNTVVKNLSLQIDVIPQLIIDELNENFIQICILRRNWIELLLSSAVANSNSQWTVRTFDKPKPLVKPVEIDIDWMIRSLKWLTRQLNDVFSRIDIDQVVWYDDVFEKETIELTGLGPVALKSCTTVKLGDKRDMISNYSEAVTALMEHFHNFPVFTEYFLITDNGVLELRDRT